MRTTHSPKAATALAFPIRPDLEGTPYATSDAAGDLHFRIERGNDLLGPRHIDLSQQVPAQYVVAKLCSLDFELLQLARGQ